jgi:diguanylate cyclase (GGDEF)-like protein
MSRFVAFVDEKIRREKNTPFEGVNVVKVTAADELRLATMGLAIGRAATFEEACRLAVREVEARLGVGCLIRAQNGMDWRTLARSDDAVEPSNDAPSTRLTLGETKTAPELIVWGALDDEWVEALGGVVTAALQLVQLRVQHREADRRTESVGRFSRALLAISDSGTLQRVILEHMARAVGAEIGALAVFLPQENSLAITATYGYPAVLVEHVRLAPGEGVLGRVFATGAPVVVSDVSAIPRQVVRRRYRTDSYIALPLTGPDGVVAVISLTDKVGGDPFTDADLSVLMLMSVPAALAVSRELMRDRTNDLAHLATVDALTGLFNRRYFETRLEQELQRQRRQMDDLSLLLLDLDNFKELNDTQGHLVGDTALKEVAEILRRAVRIFDVCARYGGEEFVILMPGAGSSTALRIAERIRRQVEQHFATGLRSGVPIPLTVSVGVSTATPDVTRDALVTRADMALLRAKATGKNQVNLHQDGAL